MTQTRPDRRRLIGSALVLGLSAALPPWPATAGPVPPTVNDMTMGDPHAKVTVIEYGSASCPHCAHFNNDVFPDFKAKYIDTGRVFYVFREFLTPPEDLAAAGFLLARCAGKDKYFSVLDAVFRAQAKMYQTGDTSGILLGIAKDAGVSEAEAHACLADKAQIDALNARVNRYVKVDKINGTPTFVINGARFNGEDSLEGLGAAVERAEASRKHSVSSH